MVTCLKTKKENTQEGLRFLRDNQWLDHEFQMGKSGKYVLLAITSEADQSAILAHISGTIEQRNLRKVEKEARTMKAALSKIIPEEQLDQINRGYEAIGDIAVIEIPDELTNLEINIAWTLKRIHPNIKVVAKKDKKTSGTYRIRKVKVLVGEKRTETLHKESGAQIKVDLNKVYFSPKMGSERLRILKQIKSDEKILVGFAGTGAYGLIFAKKFPNIRVWMIELNPSAIRLMKENIKINKLTKRVKAIKGDFTEEFTQLNEKFDRIIMVFPSNPWPYVDAVLKNAQINTTVHFYTFGNEHEIKIAFDHLNKLAHKNKQKIKILNHVKAGNFSPKVYRWCIEFKVL